MDASEAYFARRDTPSRNSPVGRLMIRIMQEDKEVSFDDARTKAIECLARAAGKRNYAVKTPGQQQRDADRLNARMGRPPRG